MEQLKGVIFQWMETFFPDIGKSITLGAGDLQEEGSRLNIQH